MTSTRPLRIGITCYPTFGGSGVIATEIGLAMARRGHRVHFICYDMPRRFDRFAENVFFHEVEITEYPLFNHGPYSLALASKMVEVITYENLDILHVHYAVPHATSAYLAKQIIGPKAPKIITTLHGTDITLVGNERSYLPITRFSIVQSDGVTAPSKFLKFATYDKLNVSSEVPIEVIPNFVDTEHFAPLAKRDLTEVRKMFCDNSFCDKEKILVHVSNFRPVKRMDDVIRMFAEVVKEVPAHLVLIGDGPERSRIEALVRELDIVKRVCFLGKQESFVSILQNSDLFLLPSESESFGLAALEAMSCGVPVIASKAGGIPEVVINGEVGYLSDVGDYKDMAKNAVRLLSDREKWQQFSMNARKLALEKFQLDTMIDRYEGYYHQILGS